MSDPSGPGLEYARIRFEAARREELETLSELAAALSADLARHREALERYVAGQLDSAPSPTLDILQSMLEDAQELANLLHAAPDI